MADAVVALSLDPTGFRSGLGVVIGGLDRLRDSGVGTARGLGALDDRADAAADGMAQLARRTDTAGDQLDDVARGVGRVDQGLRTLDANARRIDMVSDMAELAGEASQLADALGRVAGRVVEIGSGFESAQARISQVLTDANAIEGLGVSGTLEALGDAALGAAQARVGSISPEAFANATYSGISAGLSASFADAQAQVAGVLGQAAGAGVEEASSTLLTAFIALGNKANEPLAEMQAIADDLATTQQLFRIEGLGQLQQSLEPVAGLAAAFGVSRDETLAAIGILNTALEGGAPAGTAFKSFLAQLPAAADKLGIEVATTETGGVAVLETLERIRALGEGLGAAEFGALLSGALGTEAGPAAVALLGNMDQLTGAVDSLAASQGAAQTAAEKVAVTFSAQQERLANTSEALQIQLSGGALAVQRWGLQAQQAAVDTLAWAASLPGIGDSIAGVAGGALAASAGIAQFAAGGLEMSTGILSTITLLGQFGIAARLSAVASGVASIAARGLGLAMTFATGPIGLIVVGIGAAIAAGVLLWRNWDRVVGFIAGAWERVRGVIDGLPQGVLIAAAAILPIIGIPALIIRNWDRIRDFFTDLWGSVRLGWETAWNGILGTVGQFRVVVDFFRRGWDALTGIWRSAIGAVTDLWEGIQDIWDRVTGFLGFEAAPPEIPVPEGAAAPPAASPEGIAAAAGTAGVDPRAAAGEAPPGGLDLRQFVASPAPEPAGVAVAETPASTVPAPGPAAAVTLEPAGVETAGAAIPPTIAEGVEAAEPNIVERFTGFLRRTFGRRLPESDAEVGPLSRLTAAGEAIPTTMAEGVTIGAPALADAIAALPAPVVVEPAGTSPAAAAEGVATIPPAITVEPAGVAPAVVEAAPPAEVPAAGGVAPVVVTGVPAPPPAESPGEAQVMVATGAPGEAPAAPTAQFAPLVAVMRELIASSREQTAATRELLAEHELARLTATVDEPERRAPNPRPWELRDSLGEFDATVMP